MDSIQYKYLNLFKIHMHKNREFYNSEKKK